jgi:hypothetical protein
MLYPFLSGSQSDDLGAADNGVHFTNVQILFDFFNLGGYDVIGDAPCNIAFGETLLIAVSHTSKRQRDKLWKYCRTGSSRVSQNDLSIRVTTLPGALGVPR